MRIHWYDRILMTVIALFVLAVAALMIALMYQPLLANVIERLSNLPIDRQGSILLIGGGAIAAVLAAYLLCAALGRRRKPAVRSVLVRQGEDGQVEITLAALDTLVQKSVRTFAAVRDCASMVSVTPQGELLVLLRLQLMPEANVPELSQQIQAETKAYVQDHSGVAVREIRVMVESTGLNPAARVS